MGAVHRAVVPHRTRRRDLRHPRLPSADRRPLGSDQPLVRRAVRGAVPVRRAEGRPLGHGAGVRLPSSAGHGHHRGAAALRRRPGDDARRCRVFADPRIPGRRHRSRSADPLPARDRLCATSTTSRSSAPGCSAGSDASCEPSATLLSTAPSRRTSVRASERRRAVPDEHPAAADHGGVRPRRRPRPDPHRARAVDPRPRRRLRRAPHRGDVRDRCRDGHQRPHPQHPRAPDHRGRRSVRSIAVARFVARRDNTTP